MANRFTKSRGLFGDVHVSEGALVHVKSNTVAQTDTSAKDLFTLPANAIVTAVRVYGTVGSDAGTTATLVAGAHGGTGSEYMTAHNVKGAAGVGMYLSAKAIPGTVGTAAVTVTGTYAETGTASTTGGPYTVFVEYTTA